MKPGDFVRYDSPNGSVGKIVGEHPGMPGYLYVEWVYGRDTKGERMTCTSSAWEHELASEDESVVSAVENYKGWIPTREIERLRAALKGAGA